MNKLARTLPLLAVGLATACAPSLDETAFEALLPVPGPGLAYNFGIDAGAPVVVADAAEGSAASTALWRLSAADRWEQVQPELEGSFGGVVTLPSGGVAWPFSRRFIDDQGLEQLSFQLWSMHGGTPQLFAEPPVTNGFPYSFLGELDEDSWLVSGGAPEAEVATLARGGAPVSRGPDSIMTVDVESLLVLPDGRVLKSALSSSQGLWLYDADGVGEQLIPCEVLNSCTDSVATFAFVGDDILALVGNLNAPQYTIVRVDVDGKDLVPLSTFGHDVDTADGPEPFAAMLQGFAYTDDGRWFALRLTGYDAGAPATLVEGRIDGSVAPRIVVEDLFHGTQMMVRDGVLWLWDHAERTVRRARI